MSDRLLALLLRLYPAPFRVSHGAEALELIRDRWRDERGPLRRLRLGVDLLGDAVVTRLRDQPRAHQAVIVPAGAGPCFHVIHSPGPRPAAFGAGLVATTVMFAGIALMLASTGPRAGRFPLRPMWGLGPKATQATVPEPPQSAVAVDAAERRRIVEAAAAHVREHYVDRAIGRRLADTVLAHQQSGDYGGALAADALAERVTGHLREAGRDAGVPAGMFVAELIYNERPLPRGLPPEPTPASRERYRATALRQNCLFGEFQRLPNNVGYLPLLGFADAAVCEGKTREVMAAANSVGALILDLRDNGGGYGNTAMQIAAHFFDHPAYMYDPREEASARTFTASASMVDALVDTPLYLLTSSRTFSAAEFFVYNMKMLKRATIVGEPTRGGQHSGVFYGIADHFGVAVQEVAPANPYAVKGWELIGVAPDVRVPSADALSTATRLAQAQSRSRAR